MEQSDMRVLEMTSDYNMAEDIEQPMGEVPQLEDSDSGEDLVLPSQKKQLIEVAENSEQTAFDQSFNPRSPMLSELVREPSRERSRPPTKLEEEIKEGNSSDEHEVEDLSNLNIRNYDEWMA